MRLAEASGRCSAGVLSTPAQAERSELHSRTVRAGNGDATQGTCTGALGPGGERGFALFCRVFPAAAYLMVLYQGDRKGPD